MYSGVVIYTFPWGAGADFQLIPWPPKTGLKIFVVHQVGLKNFVAPQTGLKNFVAPQIHPGPGGTSINDCSLMNWYHDLVWHDYSLLLKGKDQWFKILSLVKVLSIRNTTFFTGTKTDPVNRRYKAGKLDTLKSVRSTWGNERDLDVTSLTAPFLGL